MIDLIRHADATLRRQLARLNDGVVPFWGGRFAKADDRPALVARTYAEVTQLGECFDRYGLDDRRLIDVGSGYGRLAPWLARRASVYAGIEPNDGARERAQELYPSLSFTAGTAQGLPVASKSKDVAVTWTVLQHIPDADARAALAELDRVLTSDGTLLLCEKTGGDSSAVLFPRPAGWYATQLESFELASVEPRRTEAGAKKTYCELMVFRRSP